MVRKKNERFETLRNAFGKAATANDPAALQLVGRELLTEYGKQSKLSKDEAMHRDIVQGMLVAIKAIEQLQEKGFDEGMTSEQRDRLMLQVGIMSMDFVRKQKQ